VPFDILCRNRSVKKPSFSHHQGFLVRALANASNSTSRF